MLNLICLDRLKGGIHSCFLLNLKHIISLYNMIEYQAKYCLWQLYREKFY